jgi:hypothetical protein
MALPAIVGGIVTAVQFLNSLVGEAWTRYFLILAGLFAIGFLENLTGAYILEGTISWVVANVFNIPGFMFPVYYGISSLLILAAIMPLITYLVKATVFG